MDRNRVLKPLQALPFVLFCLFFLFPLKAQAAPDNGEPASTELTKEELAYVDRAGEITIGCPVKNQPLLFENEKTGELEGIAIDIMDMIAESTGLKFRYQALPSGQITYESLKEFEIEMVAGVESNESNAQATGIAMTSPYLHAEKVFVCKRGEVFRPDSPMVIAANSGSQTLAQIIRKQYPEFEMVFCNSTEEALGLLLEGKVGAVLGNQYTIDRILCKPIYENLQIVAAASIGDSQCMACLVPIDENGKNIIDEDTGLLLSILNKGIASLDQSQVSFLIIRETAENAYQFTMWDTMYRYRYAMVIVFFSLVMIGVLLRKNHLLNVKRSEQLAAQKRAEELAAINARMKEQQLLLMDALERAEEGNRAKTTFLFNMSHDIRTPMNAILGFAEIACRSRGDEEKTMDCLGKIQTSGKHLLQLLNDMLDMAKIENGEIALTEDTCDLRECIEQARDILQLEAEKKDLTLSIDTSGVKNRHVRCDSLRLNQVLFNLLSNAIKFNRPGGRVDIRLRENPCDIREYAAYELSVKDSGIGMAPEFLEHIFEPFERERTSTMSKTQGTGLGMSITKNLVELLGGTIQVSSVLGAGTEFVLHFTFKTLDELEKDAAEIQEEDGQADAANGEPDGFLGRRLLLVEDNELNMEIAQEILCEAGFAVETAENGQIAVDMVKNSGAGYYDAVLMDIQMPVMNGYQAARAIRSLDDQELSQVPIIALTANAFDEDKKESLANGMNAHVAKPVDARVLCETLREILENRGK